MKKKQILERVEDNFEHVLTLETKEIEHREAILTLQRKVKALDADTTFLKTNDNIAIRMTEQEKEGQRQDKSLLEQKKLIDNLTTDNNKLKTQVNGLTVRLWLLENPYEYNKGDKLMLKGNKKGKPEQWIVTERNITNLYTESLLAWMPEMFRTMAKETMTDYKKIYTLVNIESGRTQILSENEIQEFEHGNRPK